MGERLFLAVRPPPSVREVLATLPAPTGRGVRLVPPDQWHVTLRFWPDAEPDGVRRFVAGAILPRAEAVLGPAVTRLGPTAVVVPVAGLEELAAAVRGAPDALGGADAAALAREASRTLRGHLTLARLRRSARDAGPDAQHDAQLAGLLGARVDASFDVESVELVESTLGPDGARHRTLDRWFVR